MAFNNYFFDPGRAHQECSFYTDTIAGNSANGKCFVAAFFADGNNSAFKFLDSFPVAFFDLDRNTDRISGCDVRECSDLIGACTDSNNLFIFYFQYNNFSALRREEGFYH